MGRELPNYSNNTASINEIHRHTHAYKYTSLQAHICTGITSEPNYPTHTIASLFFPHWFLPVAFFMAHGSERPLKWQWVRTTWIYSARSMHDHNSVHMLQQPLCSEEGEPRHPLTLSESLHEGTSYVLFLCSVTPLSGLRWPTNPRCPPCRWSRVAQEEPSAISLGWHWHGRTFRWAPEHFVATCWVTLVGLPRAPSTAAPASRQQPKSLSEWSSSGLMK